jgi:galactose mutarotase-like enzyme
MPESPPITLQDGEGALAVVAPELGGWLLRYARPLPDRGLVDALHFAQAVVDRYPKEMYAGNPVLFPLVGRNCLPDQDHGYEWNGRRFPMPQHGFGRRSKWTVLEQRTDTLSMELTDSEGTRASYPFSFRQRLTYRLARGRLHWEQVIENLSAEPMPFGTGFHPYLKVPLSDRSEREACYVELPEGRRLRPQNDLERFVSEPFPAQNWSVDQDVADTMYLTDLAQRELLLVDPASELEVALNLEDAPQHRYVALWAKATEAPYYCVEPWTSLPNAFSRTKDRDLIMLEPQRTFRAAFWLEVRPMG